MTALCACGADHNANAMPQAAATAQVTTHIAGATPPDDSASKQLTAETKQRVADAFAKLQKSGALIDAEWTQTELPTLQYGAFVLHDDADDGICDGYAHTAFVPAGPRGGADNDPNAAHEFYIWRVGGIAGNAGGAGPFELQ